MKSLFVLITFLCICMSVNGQEETSKTDFKLLDNMSLGDIVFSVYVKSEDSQFTLKICKKPDSCAITQEYVKSIEPDLLVSSVIREVKNYFSNDTITVSDDEKKKLSKLLEKLKASDFAALKASKDELENTLYAIENGKDQYSAKIILNDTIPYDVTYRVSKINTETLTPSALSMKLFEQGVARKNRYKAQYKDTTVLGQGVLKIIDAQIQFFNNKASSIYIKAELKENGKTEKLIFENNSFSVPLRYFNKYGSTVSAQTENQNWIIIDYNDVFDYESDQFFNYSVANSQISLSHKEKGKAESKVIQRRFFDFFTAIVYSDVMGFNADNSNSLLNAQAKLLLPLNLRNIECWYLHRFTPFRQIITTANIALNNSFEDESRFINIMDNDNFSNFDLLRKNNLYGKLQLDVLTHEAKGWFTNISLGYNAGFYRTGIRYTQTQADTADIIIERQLLTIGHGPSLNFEVRPQTNFGADITFSLEDLNYSGDDVIGNRSLKNDIINQTGKDHFLLDYNLINIEANFYWLTNPEKSKGGVYAKLGSYFHTDSNSIFPQIMVGYATNLSSFVNRFKPKKEIKATE